MSPRASTLTVWSETELAVTVPLATTASKLLLRASSQVTGTSGPAPEPGVASGEGVTRVHRITASGNGSPDATPCAKTAGDACACCEVEAKAATPAARIDDRSTARRDT